ncbi:MAG: hypothetical protein N2319_07805 [Candidatus Kapabacteria bacterium]|nr:hypothetical protein [Candidatus Kapabacteria bacterium]
MKINDTLEVYDDNIFDGRLYIFIDETNCFTCHLSNLNIAKSVDLVGNFQIVLFVKTKSINFFNKVKEELKWPFNIVFDFAGAYCKLYGVKNSPICYLMNNEGIIKFIGIPGNANLFNSTEFKSILDYWQTNNFEKEISKLQIIKSIIVKSDSTLLSPNIININNAIYIKKIGAYFFWDFASKNLIIADTSGNFIKFRKFNEFSRPVFSLNEAYYESIPFVDLDYNMNAKLFLFDPFKESISYSCIFTPDTLQYPFVNYFQINDSLFSVSLIPKGHNTLMSNKGLNSFRIYNLKNGHFKNVGSYDVNYYQYPLLRFFQQHFNLINSDTLIEIQNFSNKLNYFDINGNFIRSELIEFDSTHYFKKWKFYFSKLVYNSPVEEFKKLSDSITKISETNGLLFDKVTRKVYIVYQKKEKNNFENIKYFLHLHSQYYSNDIEITDYYKPFYIENGIVHCCKLINNRINIILFKL